MLKRLNGTHQCQIGSLNLSTLKIRTIIKKNEKNSGICKTSTRTSATRITSSRNNTIELDDDIKPNMLLSHAIIMETILYHIQVEIDDTTETFIASQTWFNGFK